MSCQPTTPTSGYILRASGTLTSVSTSALSQYYPLKDSVITLSNVVQGTDQPFEIVQVRVREAATAGNDQKKGLLLYFYTDAAPTTPTLAAVYDASNTNRVGQIVVAAADYTRVRSTADELWEATVLPGRDTDVGTLWGVSGTTATATNLYCVVLANEAVTYAASTNITVEVTTRVHYGSTSLT